MASRLIARRRQQPKKATTLISKQSLESAIQEGQALIDELIRIDAKDGRLDQIEQAISFLTGILKKSPVDMQAEGAASLEDYLDDAVMPEMAAKIKEDVDLIVSMKGQSTPNRNVEMTPTMASGSDNWVTNREEEKKASGSDNWVSDRVDGKPEEPVLAEVPRLASSANADLFYGKKKAAPVPVAAPAKPSADITQLSSDTLAKMQKALAGSEDLMNDKAAQAFIAAIAEELMNRPVEVEQEQPAAPAAGAPPAAAPMPMAASFSALAFAGFEDDDDEDFGFEDELPSCPACGGPGMLLGTLGNLTHYRCRNCGMDYNNEDMHTASASFDRRKDFFKQDMKRKQKEEAEAKAKDKQASNQGGSFVNDGETGNVVEDGGRTPEIAKAHAEIEDNTGIKRPATELVTKFAADDMSTGAALKKVETAGKELQALYLETKKVTKTLDSRPVREAIEAIYRAYDMMGEAAKVLNKQKMQEDAEEKAIEIKDTNKGKKSSLLDSLVFASEAEDDEPKCESCGKEHNYAPGGYVSELCQACSKKLNKK
jgi:hypothetical protein